MNTLDNEVKDAIQRLSDADLAKFIEVDFREHTEEAVAFAREELTRRGLPKKKEQPAEAAEAAEPETKVPVPETKATTPVPDAPPASPPTDSAEVAAETSPFASSLRPRRWNRALSRLLRWGRHRPSD